MHTSNNRRTRWFISIGIFIGHFKVTIIFFYGVPGNCQSCSLFVVFICRWIVTYWLYIDVAFSWRLFFHDFPCRKYTKNLIRIIIFWLFIFKCLIVSIPLKDIHRVTWLVNKLYIYIISDEFPFTFFRNTAFLNEKKKQKPDSYLKYCHVEIYRIPIEGFTHPLDVTATKSLTVPSIRLHASHRWIHCDFLV